MNSHMFPQNARYAEGFFTYYASVDLPDNLNDIKKLPAGEWRYKVKFAIEKRNKERIEEECHKTVNDIKTPKSKIKMIIDKLKQDN